MEKKNFFEKLFSIDEMKSSSLVLCLFASLGFGIFFTFEKGDLPVNLSNIIQALIYAIGGVSAVGWAANSYSNRNTSQSTYTNQNLTTMQTVQQVIPTGQEINLTQINNSTEIDPTTRGI